MAKAIAPHISHKGGEGLRGIFDPSIGEHGQLMWWVSHHASHFDGSLMLGYTRGSDVLEVEMNVGEDGTIYPCWSHFQDVQAERFLQHPMMLSLIEGCLPINGKQIQIRNSRVRLRSDPAAQGDHPAAPWTKRRKLWNDIEDDAKAWQNSRRLTLADGRPRPRADALRPFLQYLTSASDMYPVPRVEILDDRTIQISWRRTGSAITVRFADGHAHTRMNLDGRVITLNPIRFGTRPSITAWTINSKLWDFKSHGEE